MNMKKIYNNPITETIVVTVATYLCDPSSQHETLETGQGNSTETVF